MSQESGEDLSWGLLGRGNVGSELADQVERVHERWGLKALPEFVLRKTTGLQMPDGSDHSADSIEEIGELPDCLFVALSPDAAPEAYAWTKEFLAQGKRVVTAEKTSLADNYAELRQQSEGFSRLGINATVGGGLRPLEVTRSHLRDPDNVSQLHLALNGTLTFIFGSIGPLEGMGISHGQAVRQAVKLGYAEPGASDAYSVIRQEAESDVPKKVAIFMNHMGLTKDELLDWHNLTFELTDDEIHRAISEASVRRFVASVYPLNDFEEKSTNDLIGGVRHPHGDWMIVLGFQHIERNPLLTPLANLTGPNNGVVIGLGPNESDGTPKFLGEGAGPETTVNTMLDDLKYNLI